MILICPHCNRPTFFEGRKQYPGVAAGSPIRKVPANISALYNEARACSAAGAHTATVLALRKLLMNIAVNKGAKPGRHFQEYVEYLASKGYVPPDGQSWVDIIRKRGNEATHEIALMKKPDSDRLLTFAEMLLKFIYEFPPGQSRRTLKRVP